MQTSSKSILIFPKDSSIDFLEPIITQAQKSFPNIQIFCPSPNSFDLEVDDDIELIIFLGHGSSSTLYGSLDNEGQKTTFLNVDNASRVFSDTSLILLSCKSVDFIKNLKRNVSLTSYVGFGDMPTDWHHISALREFDIHYMAGFEEEHLNFYKEILVTGVIRGLELFNSVNTTRSIYLGIKQTVNAAINKIILETTWTEAVKLQMVELLCEMKYEIKYS